MRAHSKGYGREVQVAVFVILSVLVIAAFSLKITDAPIFRKGTIIVAYIQDATGLYKNSKVKLSGINIGIIRKIELENKKAKITMLIDKEHDLPAHAIAIPRPTGILGDKYIEIDLSKKGSYLWGSFQRFFAKAVDLIVPKLYADEIHLKNGDVIPSDENIGTIDSVVDNAGDVALEIKKMTKQLNNLIKKNNQSITQTIKNLEETSESSKKFINKANQWEIAKTFQELNLAIKKADASIQNVEEITGKINSGKGTLGKLINDEETIDHINYTLNTVGDAVDRARRTQIIVDINSNYLFGYEEAKSNFGLTLMPRKYFGYKIALVQDGGGKEEKTVTRTSTNGGPVQLVEETKILKGKSRLTAQILKKIWNASFRIGIIEGFGGFGFDYSFYRNRLHWSTDLFDLGRENENPHLRSHLKYSFYDHFYLQFGVDDLLSKNKKNVENSLFAGIGISFSDNNLKSLLLLTGTP